jgi:hypothetical protein
MVIELEAGLVRLVLQLIEMRLEVGNAFFGIETHRHGQVGSMDGLAH